MGSRVSPECLAQLVAAFEYPLSPEEVAPARALSWRSTRATHRSCAGRSVRKRTRPASVGFHFHSCSILWQHHDLWPHGDLGEGHVVS